MIFAGLCPSHARAEILPDGFADTLVTSVASPTAIAFTPDGRLLITTQPGVLYVLQGAVTTTALDLGPGGSNVICSQLERGLVGVTADPDFASNGFIYLYYTFNKFDDCSANVATSPVNRVSRFVLPATNVIDPASEVVLVDNIPSPSGYHNSGDLHFGADGFLYISVGDGGCQLDSPVSCQASNGNARRLDLLSGKILRIGNDGSIPATNPQATAGGARRCGDPAGVPAGAGPCAEMFVWGLRNPFRFAFRPGTDDFYIDDVGGNVWEEIDSAEVGADYGWNVREGPCLVNSSTNCGPPPVGMTNPVYAYQHGTQIPGTLSSGCGSITGGAFVPSGVWPAAFEGSYLFSDYVCGAIFQLVPRAAPGPVDFIRGLGSSSAVSMIFGPFGDSQSLYYTSFAAGGQVRRIDYTGSADRAPTAVASASPVSGPAPLTVTFDATGSSDADPDDPLLYAWIFGDGTPETGTSDPTIQHTYVSAGIYTASLRIQDSHAVFSAPVTLRIYPGDSAPSPVVESPASGELFTVGQSITLVGSAQDAEDGVIPDGSLSWTLLRHHYTHTHPFLGPITGNHITFVAPAPEDLEAAATSYLEIRLTATDSNDLAATQIVNFYPLTVADRFDSVPSCLNLLVNDESFETPFTLLSWAGFDLTVSAPDQADRLGHALTFSTWSDGGAAAHTLATPGTPLALVATFTGPPVPASRFYLVEPCRAFDTRSDLPLVAGDTRTFVLVGVCGIPSDATAVAGNLTFVSPSAPGSLAVAPSGFCLTNASTLHASGGETRANNAVLTLGLAGGVDVSYAETPSGSADLVIDVVGYFR